ncbi:MAG TPA: hypothetical protein VFZ78_13410 [Flavisolibacter sp.]
MRRIVLILLAVCTAGVVFAQTDTASKRPPLRSTAAARGNDHFMLQLGYLSWQDKPDSIRTTGFPRTFSMHFLFAFPFKTNPKWSAAIGAGFSSENMYFERMYVGIKDATSTLVFQDLKDTTHFKKYKLSNTFLEAPVELRFTSNPDDDAHSIKVAVGAKVGTMLSAMVKGKNLEDKNGNTILEYTSKEKNKKFFNNNRLSVTGRLGYGHFSVFGTYSVTPLFKEGVAAAMRPMTIGLTLSGL